MKRWRDRDFEDESDRRDEVPPGPLEVQSLALHGPLRRAAADTRLAHADHLGRHDRRTDAAVHADPHAR
jgi:hypothetical protein